MPLPPLTIVILMLHGFLGFGLNQQLTCEPNLLLVVCSHFEERSHVVQLSLEVSVEDGLVTFAASPEHYGGREEVRMKWLL